MKNNQNVAVSTHAKAQIIGGREQQEDSIEFMQEAEWLIAVVADGLGGHPYGEVASAIAARCIVDRVAMDWTYGQPFDPEASLRFAVLQANESIMAESGKRPDYAGMGTTAVCLLANSNTGEAWLCSVGDSRIIVLADGQVHDPLRETPISSWAESTYALEVVLGFPASSDDIVIKKISSQGLNALMLCSDGIETNSPDFFMNAWHATGNASGMAERIFADMSVWSETWQDNASIFVWAPEAIEG